VRYYPSADEAAAQACGFAAYFEKSASKWCRRTASRGYLGDSQGGFAYDAPMIDISKDFNFIFGGLTPPGEIIDFIKAKSVVSLAAGVFCGVLLAMAEMSLI